MQLEWRTGHKQIRSRVVIKVHIKYNMYYSDSNPFKYQHRPINHSTHSPLNTVQRVITIVRLRGLLVIIKLWMGTSNFNLFYRLTGLAADWDFGLPVHLPLTLLIIIPGQLLSGWLLMMVAWWR